MEGFKTFTQAVDMAAGICGNWRSCDDGTVLTYADMMTMAAYLDAAFPLEESFWYAVFSDGQIAFLCTADNTVNQMFIPLDSTPVPREELILTDGEQMTPVRLGQGSGAGTAAGNAGRPGSFGTEVRRG